MSDPVRRLLTALGHDPDAVTATVTKGRTARGLRVVYRDSGKPVAFYTHAQLKRRRKDASFLAKWEAAG